MCGILSLKIFVLASKSSGLLSTRKRKTYMNEVSFTNELTLGVMNSLGDYRLWLRRRACPREEIKLPIDFSHFLIDSIPRLQVNRYHN